MQWPRPLVPWACSLLASVGLSCGGDPRPPLLGSGRAVPDAGTDTRETPEDHAVGLLDGEEGEPCSDARAELSVARPNFYFVLDGSGSMLEEMPGAGGLTRHQTAREAIATMLRRVGSRVNVGVSTFPRPGGADACTTGVEIFSVRPGDSPAEDGTDGPVLAALVDRMAEFEPDGATPTAASLQALRNKLSRLEGKSYAFLLTDGAPNCDVADPCEIDRCIPNIEQASFVDGPACDADLNCCQDYLAPHLCLDDDGAVEALNELAERGTTTYIIGMPGSDIYSQVLDEMARAGGAPRGGSTDYYRVADASELALTLVALGAELANSCTVTLATTPEDRSLVSVLADGTLLAEGDDDGWLWVDDQSLEIVGEACKRWQAGAIGQLRAFEGCSVVIQ